MGFGEDVSRRVFRFGKRAVAMHEETVIRSDIEVLEAELKALWESAGKAMFDMWERGDTDMAKLSGYFEEMHRKKERIERKERQIWQVRRNAAMEAGASDAPEPLCSEGIDRGQEKDWPAAWEMETPKQEKPVAEALVTEPATAMHGRAETCNAEPAEKAQGRTEEAAVKSAVEAQSQAGTSAAGPAEEIQSQTGTSAAEPAEGIQCQADTPAAGPAEGIQCQAGTPAAVSSEKARNRTETSAEGSEKTPEQEMSAGKVPAEAQDRTETTGDGHRLEGSEREAAAGQKTEVMDGALAAPGQEAEKPAEGSVDQLAIDLADLLKKPSWDSIVIEEDAPEAESDLAGSQSDRMSEGRRTICPGCGTVCSAGARFCRKCGMELH